MYTKKHSFEILLLLFFVGFSGIYLFFKNSFKTRTSIAVVVPDFVRAAVEPTSTPIPTPAIQISSQISSDGTIKLTMKEEKNKDDTKTYTFSVTSNSDNQEKMIYSQTVDSQTSFDIPFNTFSPGKNKYFFIKRIDQDKTHYLLFKSSGETFSPEQQFIDITPLFEEKHADLTLKNVTGWANEVLLIVQTSGPSFWFEMPNHFIQLSTKF